MNKLAIVGSLAFDAIETPSGKTDKIIGGASPYIALASSYFGVKPQIISVVGGDFPKAYFHLLGGKGIDTTGVEVKADGKTMFWSGVYNKDMNQRTTLVTELNVFADFTPSVPESYKNPDVLMHYWMNTTPDDLDATIRMVDVLTINDEEARQLSGEYSLVKAALKILAMGLQYLIIKKGDNGALLFGKDGQIFFAPALPLETVADPTGAGDSFAGGFCGYMAAKGSTDFETAKAAVVAGSVMGSFCCEKFGTENLQSLSEETIAQRVKQFEQMSYFKY